MAVGAEIPVTSRTLCPVHGEHPTGKGIGMRGSIPAACPLGPGRRTTGSLQVTEANCTLPVLALVRPQVSERRPAARPAAADAPHGRELEAASTRTSASRIVSRHCGNDGLRDADAIEPPIRGRSCVGNFAERNALAVCRAKRDRWPPPSMAQTPTAPQSASGSTAIGVSATVPEHHINAFVATWAGCSSEEPRGDTPSP